MSIVKLEQVIDCQDMPDEIRKEFFKRSYAGNDCYVDFSFKEDDGSDLVKYLIEQGVTGGSVIIEHWW